MLAKEEFSQHDFYKPNSFYEKAVLLYIPDQASLHEHCRQGYYTGGVHPRGGGCCPAAPPSQTKILKPRFYRHDDIKGFT